MSILDTPKHLPLDEDQAQEYVAARLDSRRIAFPEDYEVLRNHGYEEEEARQLYNLIVNPEPQMAFPQHNVDMVRLNRNVAPACTPAFLDRQLARVWREGGIPWFIPSPR